MRRNMNVALVSLGLFLGTVGCNSFLTGDKLSNDPNNPTSGSIQTLLVGVQGGQFAFQEGTVAMMVCEWMQQCGATNGRFVEQAGRYVFGAGSNIGANGGDWNLIYGAGGLIDIDTIINVAGRASDPVSQEFVGIAEVWKAFTVGSAADMWGSIPYSQIRTSATPALDSQLAVYDTVRAILDRAIAALTSSGSNDISQDLVFGGDAAKWIATAHTLKARYFLHTLEAAANGKLGPRTVANVFTDAIAEATNGIADATGASDFSSFHVAGVSTEQNMWSQFQTNSAFASDLEAGKFLVDYMKARNDPRLPAYFCPNATAAWKATHAYAVGNRVLDPNGNAEKVTTAGTSGATQPTWATTVGATTTDGSVTWTNDGLPYGGDDFNIPQVNVSDFGCEPLRCTADFRQPYATYQENQLILAEANLGLGNTAPAQANLQNAYNAVPLTGHTASAILPAALLDSIMMEKYVVMFQNIETLSDYRRTCIPNLAYVAGNVLSLTAVPGELFYPQTERNVNSQNIPTESSEVNGGVRTSSDVKPCTGTGAQAYP